MPSQKQKGRNNRSSPVKVIKNTVLINQNIAESIRNENEQFSAISAMAESNAGDTAEIATQANTINNMVNEMTLLLKKDE